MTEKQAKVTKYVVLQNDITVIKFTTNRTYISIISAWSRGCRICHFL